MSDHKKSRDKIERVPVLGPPKKRPARSEPEPEPPPFRVRSVTAGKPDPQKTAELIAIIQALSRGRDPPH